MIYSFWFWFFFLQDHNLDEQDTDDEEEEEIEISEQVSFNNYVDMILPFFDHLPTSTWNFFILIWDKNIYVLLYRPPTLSILST